MSRAKGVYFYINKKNHKNRYKSRYRKPSVRENDRRDCSGGGWRCGRFYGLHEVSAQCSGGIRRRPFTRRILIYDFPSSRTHPV